VLLVLAAGCFPLLLSGSIPKRKSKLRLAATLGFCVLLAFLAGAALYSLTEGHSITESMVRVVERIFMTPSNVSCMYFEVYPDLRPFVEWSDIRPVRLLLGNEALMPPEGSISIEVAKTLTGVAANFNAAFVAQSWAAAGYPGVIIGALLVAGFCFAVDRFTAWVGRGIVLFPLATYYWLGFGSFGNGSFMTCVIELGLWLVPPFYCLVLARRFVRPAARPGPIEPAAATSSAAQ